jgi:hypothetical protein
MQIITYNYDQALHRVQTIITNEKLAQYPLWNWLIFHLNKYVWNFVGGNAYAEKWYDINEDNVYRLWLGQLVEALKETFYDANNDRVHKCLINCPDESVAKKIYEASPLMIRKAFVEYIISDKYKNNKKLDWEETDISSDDESILG